MMKAVAFLTMPAQHQRCSIAMHASSALRSTLAYQQQDSLHLCAELPLLRSIRCSSRQSRSGHGLLSPCPGGGRTAPVAQASLAAWRKTVARLPDLAALHAWLHHEHACYSVACQVPPFFLRPLFLLLPSSLLLSTCLPFSCPPSSWQRHIAAALDHKVGGANGHAVEATSMASNCCQGLRRSVDVPCVWPMVGEAEP
jgi:hypothetical protein